MKWDDIDMLDAVAINELEKYYFEKIKDAIASNGMTFLKTICSAFPIKDTWEDYTQKKSCFQEALERCIQSTITNNFDWEICGTPVGADSVFITPRAVIHIDAKCVLNSDNDAKNNSLSVGPNQTSYSTEVPIQKNDKEFSSNLPTIYHHEIYGELVCLTYFIKVCYDKKFDSSFSKNLTVTLNCFPNGKLATVYNCDFLNIGKNNSAELLPVLTHTDFLRYRKKGDESVLESFNTFYNYYRDPVYYLNQEQCEECGDEITSLYIEELIRDRSDKSKKVNGKKFKLSDYTILDEISLEFLENNYPSEIKDSILSYYELLSNVHILRNDMSAEDKKKLEGAYKKIKLNIYASSIRINFDKVDENCDDEFKWNRSQPIQLM